MNKNAICLLAFTNDIYLVGASLAGFIHKQYIKKFNLNIDVVLMIDETFQNYVPELSVIFDNVKIIKLDEIKLSPKYKIHHKYSKWLKYSISKWQVLNFEEYDKILFCDTEILPLDEKWYHDLFSLNAPAFLTKGHSNNYGIPIEKHKITDKIISTFEDYRISSKNFTFTIDAGLVLLKPSSNLHTEYINFIRNIEGEEGYISNNISGADETTLLLFMIFFKQIKCVSIPYEYAVISWENHKYDKSNVIGLNFLSMIKPWIKPQVTQWSDERIWHTIAECMFKKLKLKKINKVYLRLQLETLFKFSHTIKNNLMKKIPYNYEAYLDKNINIKTIKLLNYLKKIRHNIFSPNDAEFVLKRALEPVYLMEKSTQIDQTNIKKIACDS